MEALAATVEVDAARFAATGTTVVGRPDRAGSGALACYLIGEHRLIWGDPAVVERARPLAGEETLSVDDLTEMLGPVGFRLKGRGVLRLPGWIRPPAVELDAGYSAGELRADDPETVPQIRIFTDRCDPADVDEADLVDLDGFDDAAIRIVRHGGEIVAYSGAAPWSWDPAFADIGVLVHGEHRRRGLAAFVVAGTATDLLDDGRVPLYRHAAANQASAATADRLGFEAVAWVDFFVASA